MRLYKHPLGACGSPVTKESEAHHATVEGGLGVILKEEGH